MNEIEYLIILESSDKHILEFSTKASCIVDAEFKAFKYINESDYAQYNYKIKEIKVKDANEN